MRWKTKDAHTETVRKFEFFSSRADAGRKVKKTTHGEWKTSHMMHQRQKLKFNPTHQENNEVMVAHRPLWSVQSSNGEINFRGKERCRVTQMAGEDPGDTWLRTGSTHESLNVFIHMDRFCVRIKCTETPGKKPLVGCGQENRFPEC